MPSKAKPRPVPDRIRLKTGDRVMIISGKDKGQVGTIARVLSRDGKVVVEQRNESGDLVGYNLVVRHTKPQQTVAGNQPNTGGRLVKAAPIFASKVMIVDPKDGKPTRIGFRVNDDGTKVRISRRSGEALDQPDK